jgi:hypothetical protein
MFSLNFDNLLAGLAGARDLLKLSGRKTRSLSDLDPREVRRWQEELRLAREKDVYLAVQHRNMLR